MLTGMVFDIRECTIHDGPGLRTTVFLKGCPLRCSWCHNPEGLSGEPQIIGSRAGNRTAGRRFTSSELADLLNKQAAVLRASEGGVTFSGGEPLAQAAFVAEVIQKVQGLHITLDTSGFGSVADFLLLAGACNLVLFDLKLMNPTLHRRFTGQDIEPILQNLDVLATLSATCVIRVPLIPGVTDTRENLAAIAEAARRLPNLIRVELLPYHRTAGGKYGPCGMEYRPGFDESQPVNADMCPFEAASLSVRVS
jgi:pyruvate formate lyase activating enzyme